MKIPFQLIGTLWLAGDRSMQPPGTLRKAKGVSAIPSPTIRSRDGMDASQGGFSWNGSIHSCVRYGDRRFYCDDLGVLGYVNIGVQSGASVNGMQDGTPLTFVRMAIHETDNYLFVAGGGNLIKIGPDGVKSKWGIDPPTSALNVLKVRSYIGDMFIFEADGPMSWVQANTTLTQDTTDTISGTHSIVMPVVASSVATISRSVPGAPQNLMRFSGDTKLSTIHDYVSFWMKVDKPETIEYIQLDFSVGDNTFINTFSKLMRPDDSAPDIDTNQPNPDAPVIAHKEYRVLQSLTAWEKVHNDTFVNTNRKPPSGNFPDTAFVEQIPAPSTAGYQLVTNKPDVWKRVRIPKSAFDHNVADNADADWDKVYAVRITVKTNSVDAVSVKFDQMQLNGGVGMQGHYSYYETFFNSVTGSDSNPRSITIDDKPEFRPVNVPASFGTAPFASPGIDFDGMINRYAITLGRFATTDDPQIDKRKIWRTVGDGAAWFLVDTIPIAQGEYVDEVADYEELGRFHNMPADGTISASGSTATISDSQMYAYMNVDTLITVSTGEQRTVMAKLGSNQVTLDGDASWTALTYKFKRGVRDLQPEVLLFDNDPPDSTFEDAYGPFNGVMWWCRNTAAGNAHRVFYSRPGSPEAVLGFIELADTDDSTQKLVEFNSSLYCVTKGGISQIFGDGEPYSFRKVGDAPGTIEPFTVVSTPFGIAYRAEDGYRLFDGNSSQVFSPALGDIVRGREVDDFSAFEGVRATFARDEYVVTSGSVTFAYNFATQMWREVGIGLTALWNDKDRQELIAASNHAYFLLEAPGFNADVNPANSGQAAIPFAIEVAPYVHKDMDRIGLVRFIFIKANCNGAILSPTLILDDEVIELNDMVGTGMKVYEFAVNRSGRVAGVRIAGSLLHRVEVASVAAEMRHGDEVQ